VNDPKGSASTHTSQLEGGRRADLVWGLWILLNEPSHAFLPLGEVTENIYDLFGVVAVRRGRVITEESVLGDDLYHYMHEEDSDTVGAPVEREYMAVDDAGIFSAGTKGGNIFLSFGPWSKVTDPVNL